MAAALAVSPSIQMSVGGTSQSETRPLIKGRSKGIRKSLSHRLQPSTSASIPSRYQTFFYATTESKGFNAQASRFSTHLNADENPGPGTYHSQKGSLKTQSTSFSRKGTGGFASKSRRFPRGCAQSLGPGAYNPQMTDRQHDFNKAGVSSNFQHPIAVKSEVKEGHTPAPNTYNLSGVHTGKNTLVTAEAAFKSQSKREGGLVGAANPAPGHYSIRDTLLHQSTRTHRAVFESRSRREGVGRPVQGPGPADYTPFRSTDIHSSSSSQPKELPYYKQKHYLCISAPAMPLPPLPPLPGPGHYETQGSSDPEKKSVSGAVFLSTTRRWSLPSHDSRPGPGTYNPLMSNKRSYLYNMQHKWI